MYNIPPLSSDILAISLDAPSSPAINLNLSKKYSGSHTNGWGFGWYPGGHQSAQVLKDPTAQGEVVIADALADWSNFRSTVFFCKIRGAETEYSDTEAQPFSRSFAGRDWLYMHNGDLDKVQLDALHGRKKRLLEPVGTTDSELAFCNILAQVQDGDARQLPDVDPQQLMRWFRRFDELGSADMCLTDGQSVACYQGIQSPKRLYYSRLQPPLSHSRFQSDAVELTLEDPRDAFRTAFVVCSSPFTPGDWTPMMPGQLIIANRGQLIWDSAQDPANNPVMQAPQQRPQAQQLNGPMPGMQGEQAQVQNTAHVSVTNAKSVTHTPEGRALSFRLFDIVHSTHYNYTEAVQHSTHEYRLQPMVDPIQEVVFSSLALSSSAEEIQYEDVFGNQCVHCTIDTPYTDLTVTAKSRVKIFEAPPDDHSLSRRRTSIPLIWMPWQRQMMMPYLLPSELPEPQLQELTEYAMSFVERNDYHLLKTIKDINLSIYRDFKYVPGSTALSTTPFEVYASREGVCQDFANLFICLTRLLSIPSRYRMGYIYTGASYENKIQSDASHAWAEVYLPYVGWRGFDPTNGCMVLQDHIRVACGRNYVDATPTSGTIYKGGGTETMTVDVKVREVVENPE